MHPEVHLAMATTRLLHVTSCLRLSVVVTAGQENDGSGQGVPDPAISIANQCSRRRPHMSRPRVASRPLVGAPYPAMGGPNPDSVTPDLDADTLLPCSSLVEAPTSFTTRRERESPAAAVFATTWLWRRRGRGEEGKEGTGVDCFAARVAPFIINI